MVRTISLNGGPISSAKLFVLGTLSMKSVFGKICMAKYVYVGKPDVYIVNNKVSLMHRVLIAIHSHEYKDYLRKMHETLYRN